jgi:DNA processing protein
MNNRQKLSEKELFNWLRLFRSRNIGPATFWDLIKPNQLGSVKDALENVDIWSQNQQESSSKRSRAKVLASTESIEEELEEVKQYGASSISKITVKINPKGAPLIRCNSFKSVGS